MHGPPLPALGVCLPLLASLMTLAGSLWLTLGMGFKACPLCIYQRTFVMGVVAVYGVGISLGVQHRPTLNLLALPLAVAGFAVALLQAIAEWIGKIECPCGILGIGTAPQQSVVALGITLILALFGAVRVARAGHVAWRMLWWAVVLGIVLAVGGLLMSTAPKSTDEALRTTPGRLPMPFLPS